jgi:DNA-directed RNA polymerase specialized sigma24 family protein
MPKTALGEALRFLQRICALQETCDLPDHELLERFLSHRDEGAFTFLVRRHGPMILGVGRRVLGDSHEAEDVFQATFLVLARRTRSIEGKRSVGGWLHNVAQRIALRARAQMAARRTWARKAGTMRGPQPIDDLTMQELRLSV